MFIWLNSDLGTPYVTNILAHIDGWPFYKTLSMDFPLVCILPLFTVNRFNLTSAFERTKPQHTLEHLKIFCVTVSNFIIWLNFQWIRIELIHRQISAWTQLSLQNLSKSNEWINELIELVFIYIVFFYHRELTKMNVKSNKYLFKRYRSIRTAEKQIFTHIICDILAWKIKILCWNFWTNHSHILLMLVGVVM